MYYEHLGQIFWKSENYLFHAFASLKNVFFVKVTPLGTWDFRQPLPGSKQCRSIRIAWD